MKRRNFLRGATMTSLVGALGVPVISKSVVNYDTEQEYKYFKVDSPWNDHYHYVRFRRDLEDAIWVTYKPNSVDKRVMISNLGKATRYMWERITNNRFGDLTGRTHQISRQEFERAFHEAVELLFSSNRTIEIG